MAKNGMELARFAAVELDVTLRWSTPPIWRRLRMPLDATLGDLHLALQAVMGWTDSHLHSFTVGKIVYGMPGGNDWAPVKDETRVTLRRVLENRNAVVYEYDFGDSWLHDIKTTRWIETSREARAPLCVAGARACPPEDCGGIGGYAHLLEVLADPSHPEYEEYADWAGELDPERFDLEEVNAVLARIFRS